ncbi:hypothetical protein GCM10011390_43740 [Aureimonas endophytica]|uniref:FlgN protein n=1 Tax=Aureimonas endophytica TaxID=2027858 RepID=A0A916ZZ78_9HYPH|nr:flagellar protein FlgN [Aureimonas endophytica]GGE19745.1 hypothetical protein GCM10011390_43740 [Aureimonas endophytica]
MEAVLIQAINRLEGILVGETEALRDGRHVDLAEISNRKNHSLLEMTRISRGLGPELMTDELQGRLGTLRDRLEENRRVLSLHMEAASEISGIIARAMKDAESDGTYAASVGGVKREQ